MKFSHRLAYYLLGLMIGSIFLKLVIAHTAGKGFDFDYLPNARVLKNIRNKPIDITPAIILKIKQQNIENKDIKLALSNGEVDFRISNKTISSGKEYIINAVTAKKKTLTLRIINYEDKIVLKDIKID